MKLTILLSSMFLSYLLPIGCVGYYYDPEKNDSISSILNMPECQMTILAGMVAMGCFTLWYEWERGSIPSFITILFVLIGIYGVILIKENTIIHYLFGGLIFFGMIVFMGIHYHTFPNKTIVGGIITVHSICSLVLIAQCIMNCDIFLCEVALVLNFAVYYLYLHYLTVSSDKKDESEKDGSDNQVCSDVNRSSVS